MIICCFCCCALFELFKLAMPWLLGHLPGTALRDLRELEFLDVGANSFSGTWHKQTEHDSDVAVTNFVCYHDRTNSRR